MGKYKEFEHHMGPVRVGDLVMAYVPGSDGKRFITIAEVVKINKKTINVTYTESGEHWEVSIGPRHFSLHLAADEQIVQSAHYNLIRRDSQLYDALVAGGVDNWDGYDEAMGILHYDEVVDVL